jgi:two-component system, NtrC family, sensor kinase
MGKMMNAKLLIVDDESAIRKLLTRNLEGAGYECHTAESVESARKALASDTFDLLLSDLKMPGESGLELIRYAKEHYPRTGRVMITGFGAPEIASEILKVGVYGYIVKPFTSDMVLITVENALRHLRLHHHMQTCVNEQEKEISRRAEKQTAIMNNLNIGVVMLDTDMKVLEINRQMRQWFPAVTPEKATPCYHIFVSPPGDDVCEDCPMITALQTGRTCETTKTVLTIQGEREFRIVTTPVIDKSGKVYAGISSYEDFTEKLLLERDLAQAQKLEAVGQLAAGIAHEINTPIQYIGDNISFLKDSFDDIAGAMNTYGQFWQELTEKGTVPGEMSRQLSDKIEAADITYLWEEIP